MTSASRATPVEKVAAFPLPLPLARDMHSEFFVPGHTMSIASTQPSGQLPGFDERLFAFPNGAAKVRAYQKRAKGFRLSPVRQAPRDCTRCATPSWHRIGSRGSGGEDIVGGARACRVVRLGSLSINDERKLVGPLDGQVAGFRAFEIIHHGNLVVSRDNVSAHPALPVCKPICLSQDDKRAGLSRRPYFLHFGSDRMRPWRNRGTEAPGTRCPVRKANVGIRARTGFRL
jgi:hypothetical protein